MGINIGASEISNIMLGSLQVQSIMIGSNDVWAENNNQTESYTLLVENEIKGAE